MSRRALLVPLCAAALLCSCATDLAPVDAQKTADCLVGEGRPTRTIPPSAPTPRAWGGVRAAKGRTVVLAVDHPRTREGGPWAYLFFFTGTKRARAAAEQYVELPAQSRLRSTRRQNVVVLLGRRGDAGSAPRRGDERRLKRCFDRATS